MSSRISDNRQREQGDQHYQLIVSSSRKIVILLENCLDRLWEIGVTLQIKFEGIVFF